MLQYHIHLGWFKNTLPAICMDAVMDCNLTSILKEASADSTIDIHCSVVYVLAVLFCLHTLTDLNKLIAKLDKRSAKSGEKNLKHFKRLRRDLSTPTECDPPTHGPKWAVDASYRSTDGDGPQEDLEYAGGDMYHFDLPAAALGQSPTAPAVSESELDFALQHESGDSDFS